MRPIAPLLTALVLTHSAACGGEEAFDISIRVRTDATPLVEFDEVSVTLDNVGEQLYRVPPGADFEAGVSVARYFVVRAGRHDIEARLLLDGRPVSSGRSAVSVGPMTSFVVTVARQCTGQGCVEPPGPDGGPGPTDGGPRPDRPIEPPPTDAGPPPNVSLLDDCSDPVTTALTGTAVGIPIDFSRLDAAPAATPCGLSTGGSPPESRDVFIPLALPAGTRWIAELTAPAGAFGSYAQAMFTMEGTCNPQRCIQSIASPCASVRLSQIFVARSSTLFLGLHGQGQTTLDLVQNICGDGVRQRGESCDDTNMVDGDGCSSACLTEISAGATTTESEPNNSFEGANLLRLDRGENATVSGSIVDRCSDVDLFVVNTDAGDRVELTPMDCSPQYRVTAIRLNDGSMVAEAICTTERSAALPASVVAILVQAGPNPVNYRLRVALTN